MESQKLGFASSLLAVCGILTISFSLSWGIWSEYHPISYYINHHAFFIAATGIGLLCAINIELKKRIEDLESIVNQMKGVK